MQSQDSSAKAWHCFLCRQSHLKDFDCRSIEGAVCAVSKKPLRTVLEYLIRCHKADLQIPDDGVLCLRCHDELLEYDDAMCRVMQKQRKLINLIENCTLAADGDSENEEENCSLEEFIEEINFDDVLVSDEEVERTVREALEDEISDTVEPQPDDEEDSIKESSRSLDRMSKAVIVKGWRRLVQCPLCESRFRSKDILHRHINSVHKKFKCDFCDYSHRNHDYVKLHMNAHEGRSEECCLYCHKQFSTKISTIRHMEAHLNDKRYQCDKCGLCFSQTTVLYNHRLQHEAEEQPLQCDICRNMFKTKRTYRHHMLTHRVDRPRFSCEYCDKTFTEKYTLKVHKRCHALKEGAAGQPVAPIPEVGSTVQIQSSDNEQLAIIMDTLQS